MAVYWLSVPAVLSVSITLHISENLEKVSEPLRHTLLTKSELFSFNFRKFYLSPAKNVEMGSRH